MGRIGIIPHFLHGLLYANRLDGFFILDSVLPPHAEVVIETRSFRRSLWRLGANQFRLTFILLLLLK
jgi:hypothetical protein